MPPVKSSMPMRSMIRPPGPLAAANQFLQDSSGRALGAPLRPRREVGAGRAGDRAAVQGDVVERLGQHLRADRPGVRQPLRLPCWSREQRKPVPTVQAAGTPSRAAGTAPVTRKSASTRPGPNARITVPLVGQRRGQAVRVGEPDATVRRGRFLVRPARWERRQRAHHDRTPARGDDGPGGLCREPPPPQARRRAPRPLGRAGPPGRGRGTRSGSGCARVPSSAEPC